MREIAEHPYQGNVFYRQFNTKNGRWMIHMRHVGTGYKTTTSYARYLMSVKEGRLLGRNEQVDHINDNKADDRLENLQILTPRANTIKSKAKNAKRARMADLICPTCGVAFQRKAAQIEWKLLAGREPACSKTCGGKRGYRVHPVTREVSGRICKAA